MNVELLKLARDHLPDHLNRGTIGALGGVCVLSYMWRIGTGGHGLYLWGAIETIGHPDPRLGGPIVDVISRVYEVPADDVRKLMLANDRATSSERSAVVGGILDEWIARGNA